MNKTNRDRKNTSSVTSLSAVKMKEDNLKQRKKGKTLKKLDVL